MDKQKRLDKARSVLEKKVKASRQRKEQSRQLLDDLNEKKSMLKSARQSCSGDRGERISAMSCWSRDEFVQVLNNASLLVEREITHEKQRLDSIETQLKKEVVQEQGLEHLKNQHALKAEELELRQERQDAEDQLQKSSGQKQT